MTDFPDHISTVRVDECAFVVIAEGDGRVEVIASVPANLVAARLRQLAAELDTTEVGQEFLDAFGDQVCHRCMLPNPVWRAPDDIWWQVFPDGKGIVCPSCFIRQAESVGIGQDGIWTVTPEPAPTRFLPDLPHPDTAETAEERHELLRQWQDWASRLHDGTYPGEAADGPM